MAEKTLKEWTVLMRKHCAPEPHMERAKLSVCRWCGEDFWQWKGQFHKLCPDCAGGMVMSTSIEQSTKSGPSYEKMVLGALRHWLGEAKRLGLPLDVDN